MGPVGGVHEGPAGVGVQGVAARLEVGRLGVGGLPGLPGLPGAGGRGRQAAPPLTVHAGVVRGEEVRGG